MTWYTKCTQKKKSCVFCTEMFRCSGINYPYNNEIMRNNISQIYKMFLTHELNQIFNPNMQKEIEKLKFHRDLPFNATVLDNQIFKYSTCRFQGLPKMYSSKPSWPGEEWHYQNLYTKARGTQATVPRRKTTCTRQKG